MWLWKVTCIYIYSLRNKCTSQLHLSLWKPLPEKEDRKHYRGECWIKALLAKCCIFGWSSHVDIFGLRRLHEVLRHQQSYVIAKADPYSPLFLPLHPGSSAHFQSCGMWPGPYSQIYPCGTGDSQNRTQQSVTLCTFKTLSKHELPNCYIPLNFFKCERLVSSLIDFPHF